MATKRITNVDFIDSLNNNESFFINKNNTIKQISKNNIIFDVANGGTGAVNASDALVNLGAAPSEHTHKTIVANSGAGIVRLGYESNSDNGNNYYLRADKNEENDKHILGSPKNHWDKAFIDDVIVEDGSSVASELWVTSQIQNAIDKTWEANY